MVSPDLAERLSLDSGLAKAGVTKLDEVQRLIAGYRVRYGGAHGPASGLESAHAHGPDESEDHRAN